MNWLDSLLHLNPEQIVVRHEPMTPRYQRAGQWLRFLVVKGIYLGQREHDDFSPD